MEVQFEHVKHIESDRADLEVKSKSFLVRSLMRFEVVKSEAQANMVWIIFSIILLAASFALTFITRVTTGPVLHAEIPPALQDLNN